MQTTRQRLIAVGTFINVLGTGVFQVSTALYFTRPVGLSVAHGSSPWPTIFINLQIPAIPRSVMKADSNHDGVSDFVIYSSGTWPVKSRTGSNPYLVQGITADYNHDGISDFRHPLRRKRGPSNQAAPPNSYIAQGL
jgi:hypothetical protein